MIISHSQPTIAPVDAENIYKVTRSSQIAGGRIVERFEKKLSGFIGVKYGAAVSSGTAALHLSLLALGIGPGDEVLLPSYVCSAPLNAVCYTGAFPVICDINPRDFNISIDDVKRKISAQTKAIIVPHMFGIPADIKELLNLSVPVIEDCAHSIGATYQGKKAGSFGLLSICSFYATKMLTTGEGGMVLTNSGNLLKKIRDCRDYDRKQNYKVRYNYKMTDMQAALGLSQLTKLSSFIIRRKQIARQFSECFSKCKDIELPPVYLHPGVKSAVFYRYIIKLKNKQSISAILNSFREKGISAERPVYKPLHNYLKLKKLPNTDEAYRKCISLPIYPGLKEREVKYIIDTVTQTLG